MRDDQYDDDEYEDEMLEDEGNSYDDDERNAKLGAIGISVLVHAVVLMLLALVVFATYIEVEPAPTNTVTPTPIEKDDEEDPEEPEPEVEVQVDVAVENVQVEVVTEVEMVVETTEVSIAETTDALEASDMGSSGAFAAIGAGGGNAGAAGGGAFFGAMGGGGGGGNGVGFFGAKSSASGNIFFIIDMSASLNNQQEDLIKDRLMGTINDFGPGEQFEIAFFSGPTWLMFEDEDLIRAYWDNPTGKANDFYLKPDAPSIDTQWRSTSPMLKKEILDYLYEIEQSWGTDWRNPFELAYNMEPHPEVIFFLTDGAVSNPEATIEQVRLFPHIPVMTIGFGLKAGGNGALALEEMSKITGGQHIALSKEEIEKIYNEEKPGVDRPYGAPSAGTTP